MAIIKRRSHTKKAGQAVDAPQSAPSRHSVVIKKSSHDTAQDWGIHHELLKAWNKEASLEPGSSVFIDPPEVS